MRIPLLSFYASLKSLFRRSIISAPPRNNTSTFARLGFEQLEDRACPAGAPYVWTGAVSDLWSVANNWTVGGAVAAVAPSAGNDLVFDNTSNVNSTDDLFIGLLGYNSVTLQGYTRTIKLNQDLYVYNLTQAGGNITAGTAGTIYVRGTANWSAGEQSLTTLEMGVASVLNFEGGLGDRPELLGSSVNNRGGTVNWVKGDVSLTGSISNSNGAVFNVSCSGDTTAMARHPPPFPSMGPLPLTLLPAVLLFKSRC